eukprot:CAMPEP_0172424634 /NCGR_PEP_ID=MMETSP1064-20121228/26905_1 /TAXON_ID=202472 /ORGANISM="Aulacoseira subarctica , Strain CCAP 1002/5" /LENGTH=70 /DNA_ID=CAMNT_0013166917 /DNA_START=29 /DNA_END=237 /DNA_ORIENTATION=-
MARLKSSNVLKRPKSAEERVNIRRTSPVVRPTAAAVRRRRRPGERALMEIRAYQKSSDLLLRKLPFSRLV